MSTPDRRRAMLRRNIESELKYKRSFFVRMVSDPKLYNPKILAKSVTFAEEPISEAFIDNCGRVEDKTKPAQ